MNAVEKINQELKGISEKLKPCPFCGGEAYMDWTTLYDNTKPYSIEKAEKRYWGQCTKCSTQRGCVSYPTPVGAFEAWNTRAQLYTHIKPEDVKEGYYWLVTPNTENTIERIWDGHNNGVLGMETVDGMWITVEEIYEWGGMLYRVPELEGEA